MRKVILQEFVSLDGFAAGPKDSVDFVPASTQGDHSFGQRQMGLMGAGLLLVGMPLWLESYAAAMLAIVPIGILIVRILLEEQFLRRRLEGYDGFTQRVRYRLIPYVW
jgi:hypothetical protein